MAATNNYGLNYSAKNRIRRFHEQGMGTQEIASRLRCTVDLVTRYLRTLNEKAAAVDEPVAEVATGGADAFGPLPESPEWAALTPGQKGQISKRRNAV